MAKSLEEYTAEISRSYDNSRNALQNQINAIEGDLTKTKQQIEDRYNLQQDQLNQQRDMAASSSSLAASRNGGSFGGAGEIASRKYYEQTFVPAQASLNTSRNQSLDNATSQANANRLSLEQQLAAMNDEVNRLGLQRYYDELERERQEALQRAQIAAQNAAARYLAQAQQQAQQPTYRTWDFGNGYQLIDNNGEAVYARNGNRISAGNFLEGTGANGVNWNLWNDVWNNGVSTAGVGGDTVSAFNRQSPNNPNYGYLFR